ncbi:hypothetical protein OFC56_41215, partial [Escherichia coli]|nr:hypothetical protein [Escherichia coli]
YRRIKIVIVINHWIIKSPVGLQGLIMYLEFVLEINRVVVTSTFNSAKLRGVFEDRRAMV